MADKLEYWGPEQEQAVIDFLSVGDFIVISEGDNYNPPKVIWTGDTKQERERNRIFETHLKDPLDRMVDIIIRRYKLFSKIDEYKDHHSDALSFLMMKAHKFKPEKNKKSYSYFGTIIKRYLIGVLTKDYKKSKTSVNYDDFSFEIEENEEHSYNIDDDILDIG